MGNITETTHFENLQETLEHESFIDEVTMASYESEVDLDRDIPFDPDEVDVITDHLDEVTEVEQMEADAELYFEGMGHA
ncbi:MAG: hypothetical protein CMB81_05820 [Flammeovirgaceae bacterium]|nr:hypothetical protein [Flammeovirgaceae bacterium]|tara:strand:- start:1284 stop:1520 length:237 start_codon:yes stop_codon:yes gene_type:complete